MKNKQNHSPLTATFTSLAAAAFMISGCDQNTPKPNNSPDAPLTESSNTNAIQKRIAAIVQERFGRKEEITPNLRIVEDLKGDSLDAVELVMAIEEEFHIEIADEAAEKMKTVGDVVSYVEKALASGLLDEVSVLAIARAAVATNDTWVARAEFDIPKRQPDGSWSVLVWRLPKTPGGHRSISIDKNGRVTDYGRGR